MMLTTTAETFRYLRNALNYVILYTRVDSARSEAIQILEDAHAQLMREVRYQAGFSL